jgi:hypothetical protein
MRDFAHALHLLKAYSDNGGGGSATSAADGATTTGGISVEA